MQQLPLAHPCADGIGPSQVGICSARDEGQERMRKSPCEGCFVLHKSAHGNRDPNGSPSSDPARPIQCCASDGSKILCERWRQLFENIHHAIPSFEYEMSREFVRGKSWGHEPSEVKLVNYTGLFPFFSMQNRCACQTARR